MIATNAFKQAVVGTYTTSDTVIELNSISDTVGDSDYLPNGGFNLILYDGLFGNPADANNAGSYEILECTSVNYADNEITVTRAQENTTAVTIGAGSWQVVYGATKGLLDGLVPKSDIVNDLTTGGVAVPLSAEQGKVLEDNKAGLAGGSDANFTAMPQVGGVDMVYSDYDIWGLTTTFSGDAIPIASNLVRSTRDGFSLIGSGMSQTSGIFTFPRTGIWEVDFISRRALEANESERSATSSIQVTLNNSEYSNVGVGTVSLFADSGTVFSTCAVKTQIEVDDVGNVKCRFRSVSVNSNTRTDGDSDGTQTYMIFKRLRDT